MMGPHRFPDSGPRNGRTINELRLIALRGSRLKSGFCAHWAQTADGIKPLEKRRKE
jgi:hypothetical protein